MRTWPRAPLCASRARDGSCGTEVTRRGGGGAALFDFSPRLPAITNLPLSAERTRRIDLADADVELPVVAPHEVAVRRELLPLRVGEDSERAQDRQPDPVRRRRGAVLALDGDAEALAVDARAPESFRA